MSHTIIVPLDGSKESEQSIPFAQLLAARTGSTMLLLSVVEISTEFDAWVEAAPFSLEDDLDRWIEDRREYLNSLAVSMDEDATVEIRAGRPAHEIVGVVESVESPIVVIASHGRGGVQQFVLGSVALQVVHDVHTPVVVIRIQDDAGKAPASIERVLLPADASDFSDSAIHEALDILGDPKPTLQLLHVLEEPRWSGRSVDASLVAQYLEASRESSRDHLNQVAATLRSRGYEVDLELRDGRVSYEILAIAADQGVDLIAMATHGRGGVGRLLLGSVAQRVLHQASVPLMLIHPEDGK